jgi:hypothetical protein
MKNFGARFIFSATVVAMVAATLSGCASGTASSSPADALAAAANSTSAKIAATGAVAASKVHGGTSINEVHDPSDAGGLYVNDAVLTGATLDFKQISRQSPGDMKSFEAAAQIAQAKVDDVVQYASANFKVLSSVVVANKTGFVQTVRVHDVYGNMGTFNARIVYGVNQGLISSVDFDKALFDKSNPEEVCLYYPTNCVSHLTLNFDTNTVTALMRQALAKYESAQNLASGDNQSFFEAIMNKMDKTVKADKSWTTTNTDKTAGTVFDAANNKGVVFSSYGDATAITTSDAHDGRHGPDNGFVSGLFFDTTDGGSTYFYGPITYVSATGLYTINDSQNNMVANLWFANGFLADYTDNTIGINDKFTIRNTVDTDLLNTKWAKVPKN